MTEATENKPEHAPMSLALPWRAKGTSGIADAHSRILAVVPREPWDPDDIRDHILRACNSHQKLVKACRRAAGFFDSQRIGTIVMPGSVIHDLRAGLAAAEGESHE